MLKVVGASWEQTRVTSLLLLAVTVVGIFAIFFYEAPAIVYDGNYSATIDWGSETGFRVTYWGQNNDPQSIKKGLARAYYRPDFSQNGWAAIEIETQEGYPDWVQAYGAGILEGALCWQLIYWHWQNTVKSTCKGREEFCTEVKKALEENEAAMRQLAKNESKDPYWHQVDLFYLQLDGMYEGWKRGIERNRKDDLDISKTDFLYHYKNEQGSPLVPGQTLLFTSYPASIHSQDDFYLINGTSKMSIAGAAIKNFRNDINQTIDFGEVLMGPRVLAANRLALSAKKWRLIMGMHNSGTGSKEWLVVDNSKSDVRLWVVDQVAGVTVGRDETNEWKKRGYWFHYGVPYFNETYYSAGYDSDHPEVQRLKGVGKELNATVSNITSRTDIIKMFASSEFVLLGRGDIASLNDTSSTNRQIIVQLPLQTSAVLRESSGDEDEEIGKEYEGIIDLKICSESESFSATAGPPFTKASLPFIAPFQWSKSVLDLVIPHNGQSDLWDFPHVQLTWSW